MIYSLLQRAKLAAHFGELGLSAPQSSFQFQNNRLPVLIFLGPLHPERAERALSGLEETENPARGASNLCEYVAGKI